MTKAAFTINELATEIGIGRSKIYLLMAEGKLKARKIGKRTIFLAEDVQAYLSNLPTAA